MGLCTNAVIFVFHDRIREISERFLRICRRAGQHEANGME